MSCLEWLLKWIKINFKLKKKNFFCPNVSTSHVDWLGVLFDKLTISTNNLKLIVKLALEVCLNLKKVLSRVKILNHAIM